jgi:collagenase-like PrtC family protease
MKLMLPTNWDPTLIGQIAPFSPEYIYGSLPGEATMRPTFVLSPANEDDIALHIAEAARQGIRFIYVMNATCLGNKEYCEEGRGELLQRLQWVVEIGAAGVVTANPFLMELMREHFPSLELHISVLASVDDARKAKFFEDLGATLIHLDPQINRDFRRLNAIRRSVGTRLSVVVNEGCLLSCPIRQYHSNMISHSGESIAGRYYVDYCYYQCSLAKVRDEVEYLRSPWIRPEDVAIYEQLGIDLFKVAGREKMGEGPSSHTDWIAMVAEAYHTRRCRDIARLLVGIQPPMSLMGEAPQSLQVRIDSRKLDGFLKIFREDRCSLDCTRCDYCGQWARRAVSLKGRTEECAGELETNLETIRVGSYRSGT